MKKFISFKTYISIILFLLSIFILFISKDNGIIDTIKWLTIVFLLSIVGKNIHPFKQLSFIDGGFSIFFSIGIGCSFLLQWFFNAINVIPFNTITSIIITTLFFLLVFFINHKNNKKLFKNSKDIENFLFGFALFTFFFTIAFWIKGFNANVYSTEKMMDYGFMTSMFRQEHFPPQDFWFSNTYLNYYYFGQAISTFVCKLAFTTPEYGYNLMLCTLFTTLLLNSFTLIESVSSHFVNAKSKFTIFGGIVGTTMTTLAGNGHWIIYGMIIPFIEKIKSISLQDPYWFPNSTRFIGYNPDVADKTIHEFPSYSFVLGDLHAHVCDTMFVLPLITLLFDYVIKNQHFKEPLPKNIKEFVSHTTTPFVFLVSIFFALFQGTNYWDFPIYFVIAGAFILFSDWGTYGFNLKTTIYVILKGLIMILYSSIIMLPFNLYFEKMVSSIQFCKNHSALWQLLILWFIPIFIVILYYIHLLHKKRTSNEKLSPIEISIFAMSLCAIGLVILPEIIYVKDIYTEIYARSNTMFKLTYQAFILFGLSIGFITTTFAKKIKKKISFYSISTIGITIITFILSLYIVHSTNAWFGNVFKYEDREGISATEFLTSSYDFYLDVEAINYLNNVNEKQINIIEASGTAYTSNNKISVFTGTNTILGWYGHEWLWKNNVDIVNKRNLEVEKFYTSGNLEFCAYVLDKYDIDYIYVGTEETKKYVVNYNGFISLGEIVLSQNNNEQLLIKVNKDIVTNYVYK